MSGLDDYNDRLRKQTLGVPVGPATNLAQTAADRAAEAQRTARSPGRSAGGSYGGQAEHSVRYLLAVLALSLPVCLAGIAVLNIFSGDLAFLGWIAALAGGAFAVGSIGLLLKRFVKWVLSLIIIGIGMALGAVGRAVARPFRRR